jgi:hypothetical protein
MPQLQPLLSAKVCGGNERVKGYNEAETHDIRTKSGASGAY